MIKMTRMKITDSPSLKNFGGALPIDAPAPDLTRNPPSEGRINIIHLTENGQLAVGTGAGNNGTEEPNPGSAFEIQSTIGMFSCPKMTTTQRNAIPVNSQSRGIILNTTRNALEFFNGLIWIPLFPSVLVEKIVNDVTLQLPSGYTTLNIVCIGGGGGGASGSVNATNTETFGGGGGQGGGWSSSCVSVDDIISIGADALEISVGFGGIGGASQVNDSSSGNDGEAGGKTSVIVAGITLCEALGGAFGISNSGGASSDTNGENNGGAGGCGGGSSVGDSGSPAIKAPGGGGGGGGLTNGNEAKNGGDGGGLPRGVNVSSEPGGSGGVSGGIGTSGGDGTEGFSASGGSGGGGGGSSLAANGGNGGIGGPIGGGGGGGGACRNGYDSGAGQDGSNGIVLLVWSR